MTGMIEKLCRAVRPDFDELYRDKAHYKNDAFGAGRKRKSDFGINGPFQSDIRDDVRLILEALKEPSTAELSPSTFAIFRDVIQAILDEAER